MKSSFFFIKSIKLSKTNKRNTLLAVDEFIVDIDYNVRLKNCKMEYFASAMALSLNLISHIHSIDFIISAYSTTKTKMP